jgi:hypothetical protein
MASEITLTDPLKNPAINFIITNEVLEIIDILAAAVLLLMIYLVFTKL